MSEYNIFYYTVVAKKRKTTSLVILLTKSFYVFWPPSKPYIAPNRFALEEVSSSEFEVTNVKLIEKITMKTRQVFSTFMIEGL